MPISTVYATFGPSVTAVVKAYSHELKVHGASMHMRI